MAGLAWQNFLAATAVVMLIGRFGTLAAVIAIAGGLVRQPRNTAPNRGAISTSSPFFGLLLGATALVVTALTFLPADGLAPIAEALLLHRNASF
jgi:K+-transporting ATPase ATPase A chain